MVVSIGCVGWMSGGCATARGWVPDGTWWLPGRRLVTQTLHSGPHEPQRHPSQTFNHITPKRIPPHRILSLLDSYHTEATPSDKLRALSRQAQWIATRRLHLAMPRPHMQGRRRTLPPMMKTARRPTCRERLLCAC
jgi:hypothetical protein